MSLWNLGGMNPNFKEFLEEHPDKTVIGVGWAFYWRFFVLILIIEALLFGAILVIGGIASLSS